MTMSDKTDHTDDRAEEALRHALATEDLPPLPDPDHIRRRVRDRRVGQAAAVGCLVLAVLVGGFVATAQRLDRADIEAAGPQTAQPVDPTRSSTDPGGLPADPARPGWRTEYYRGISFEVPDTWGYAYEPGADWCADSQDGKPDDQHRQPYVALGRPLGVRTIGCPDQPVSLTSEHVAVHIIEPNVKYALPRDVRLDDWWVVGRGVGGLVLTVRSKDHTLARQIADSARLSTGAAPCDPKHPLVKDRPARPKPAFDVTKVKNVGAMVVCQYEASAGSDGLGLRAVAHLDNLASTAAIDAIVRAPIMAAEPCQTPTSREIALLVRFETDGGLRELYLQAGSCATGTGYGGFDDGTNVRTLTQAACRAVLVPPTLFSEGSRYVGTACAG
jgi:hypothetical protein